MMWNCKLATLLPLAALAVATNAHTQPPPQEVRSFVDRSVADQKRILQRLETAMDALHNPYLDAVRAYTEAGADKRAARTKAMRKRSVKSRSGSSYRAVAGELVGTVRYRFGTGVVEPVHKSRRDRARAGREVPVALSISGMLPGTDVAFAEMLRRLDSDDSADHFIAFLEAWRNGCESFYEALDRTAGTQDGSSTTPCWATLCRCAPRPANLASSNCDGDSTRHTARCTAPSSPIGSTVPCARPWP